MGGCDKEISLVGLDGGGMGRPSSGMLGWGAWLEGGGRDKEGGRDGSWWIWGADEGGGGAGEG